jgi:hypothetical protein
MGQTVAVSKSVAVVVALLPWKLATVISEKNSLEGVKTHQAPFQLCIVCQCGVVWWCDGVVS